MFFSRELPSIVDSSLPFFPLSCMLVFQWPFLTVFLCACLYRRDAETVMGRRGWRRWNLYSFSSTSPQCSLRAGGWWMHSPFCGNVRLPLHTEYLLTSYNMAPGQSRCCTDPCWLHAGRVSPSSGLCAVFRQSIPKVPFGWLAHAISPCSHRLCFTSSCLRNCSPCSLLSQGCHCVFVEAPCEPKSTAVTKSAAGPVLPMSVISVISIWRDDVYFIFPIQILPEAGYGTVWSRGLSCIANPMSMPAFSSWTALFLFYWRYPSISVLQPICYDPERRTRNNCMERKKSSDSCGPQVLTLLWE